MMVAVAVRCRIAILRAGVFGGGVWQNYHAPLIWQNRHTPPQDTPRWFFWFAVMTLFISLWTMFITYDIASAACSS
jgi:hypothetical protein